MTPIILICGNAGSGKDTVADRIVNHHNATKLSLADPMKRLAKEVFNFSDLQMWGPSHQRNLPIMRFAVAEEWMYAKERLESISVPWCRDVFGSDKYAKKLFQWFKDLPKAPISGRYVLQSLGTEYGRVVSKDVWIDYAVRNAMTLLGGGHTYTSQFGLVMEDPKLNVQGPDWVVISDGRFRNEVMKVLALGGKTWKIAHKETGEEVEKAGIKNHASETEQRGIPDHFFTSVLENDKSKGLESCYASVDELITATKYISRIS